MTRDARYGHLIRSHPVEPNGLQTKPRSEIPNLYSIPSDYVPLLHHHLSMVGANYTGGRRNAAKARSKDTTGRLQRGHFSKQRLGILTDALRSRRPDHQSLSRPCPVTDNPNLTVTPRPGFLISPSGYSTCTPLATVHDISLGHAKRDLAQKQLLLRQSTQQVSHPHRNDHTFFSGPSSQSEQLRSDLHNAATPTVKGEPDPAPNLQTLLPKAASPVGQPCATPPPHPGPALSPASLPEKQQTLTIQKTPKPQSRILDLIDASDRKHPFSGFFRLPHPLCSTYRSMNHRASRCRCTSYPTLFTLLTSLSRSYLCRAFPIYPHP